MLTHTLNGNARHRLGPRFSLTGGKLPTFSFVPFEIIVNCINLKNVTKCFQLNVSVFLFVTNGAVDAEICCADGAIYVFAINASVRCWLVLDSRLLVSQRIFRYSLCLDMLLRILNSRYVITLVLLLWPFLVLCGAAAQEWGQIK